VCRDHIDLHSFPTRRSSDLTINVYVVIARLEYFSKANLLNILYKADPSPEQRPIKIVNNGKFSKSSGNSSTTRVVPINVVKRARTSGVVNRSLKRNTDQIITKGGAVYNNAAETDVEANSIV